MNIDFGFVRYSEGVVSVGLDVGFNRFIGFGWKQKTVYVVYRLSAAQVSYLGNWGGALQGAQGGALWFHVVNVYCALSL